MTTNHHHCQQQQQPNNNSNLQNKLLGCGMGAIVGDAFGMPTEFKRFPFSGKGANKQGFIERMVSGESIDGFGNLLPAGHFTDDTEMALCVLRAYQLNCNTALTTEQVAKEFIEWYKKQPDDVGAYTRNILEQVKKPQDAQKVIAQVYAQDPSKGESNGCVMRCWPVSVVNASKSEQRLLNDSVAQCKATHLNRGAVGIALFVNLIHYKMFNEPETNKKKILVSALKNKVVREWLPDKFVTAIVDAIRKPLYFEELIVKKGCNTGWALNTIVNAIHAFLTTDSYYNSILYAANLGDDADTVASVVGGIAGAYYGFDNIPSDLLDVVKGKFPIHDGPLLRQNELKQMILSLVDSGSGQGQANLKPKTSSTPNTSKPSYSTMINANAQQQSQTLQVATRFKKIGG